MEFNFKSILARLEQTHNSNQMHSTLTDYTRTPIVDVLSDPLQNGRLGVQIVHWNVEKALDLTGMQIHCDDVIGAGHREHVGDQFGADRCSRLQGCSIAQERSK